MNQARADILALLNGQAPSDAPAFSGLIHITTEGLTRSGLRLHEIHQDARKLAEAAASTFHLSGMASAALPIDLCAPAEALGSPLNYGTGENEFPQPSRPLFASTGYLNAAYFESADHVRRGRLPIICEAIRLLKDRIDTEAVISGIIPGPYTLLLYLVEPGRLFAEMKREPALVADALTRLASFLAQVGAAYREAGADLITVHDMGGSPGFIGPAKYEQFAHPAERQLLEQLSPPRILSICGNPNKSLALLAKTGAEAISLDQTADLARAREALEGTLLFGNIDPVATLWQGDAAQIVEAVQRAKNAGVDAIWPGCDLVPATPIRNVQAMVNR